MVKAREVGRMVDRITERRAIAEQLGRDLYHPAVSVADAWATLCNGGTAYLSDIEKAAFYESSPAAFQAGFAAGWAQAMPVDR